MRVHRHARLFAAVPIVLCALIASSVAGGHGTAPRVGDTPVDFPSARKQTSTLASQLARARLATGKYSTNLRRAKADGYRIITRMMPGMGYHFLNPAIAGFDVTKPPILVYVRNGDDWQLDALEWVFPEKPSSPPLEGARYGSFAAACHYVDGTFVPADAQAKCAKRSPATGAPFRFWHPDLVTMHVWLWYHNPDGLFASMNPLIAPFDHS
jgi:hypothetical protein